MTRQIHVIRLREPWQREAVPGGIRIGRAFNCPTGLDQGQQVWLVIDVPSRSGTVLCNEKTLGALANDGPTEFNITSCLALHNQVCVEIAGTDAATALDASADAARQGFARLEIRSP